MVDVVSITNALIKGLNDYFPNYTYQRANQDGNMPPYPYITIDCMTPKLKDMDNDRGTITYKNVDGDDTKVQKIRSELPKQIFSFNCVSNDQDQALEVAKNTVDWLNFLNEQYLETCGIVVVGVDSFGDRTTYLETGYQYKYGFDLTIRVSDDISININSIASVETENLTK